MPAKYIRKSTVSLPVIYYVAYGRGWLSERLDHIESALYVVRTPGPRNLPPGLNLCSHWFTPP